LCLIPALVAADPIPSAITPSTLALTALIADRIAPLVPTGERVDQVTLDCDPPAGATVSEVAPGVTQLQSRSFVVVLEHDHRTLACGATVRAERHVLVAVHDIAPGDPVAESDFRSQWVDAFGGAINDLAEFPQGSGLIAASAIRAGQSPGPWQLKRPAAVHPGDLVSVMVTNGPITVRAQLRATSTAALGETATVINPESGLPVAVTVTGSKTAELEIQ
jgi:flagella basal body P-ring formation protein FlgA